MIVTHDIFTLTVLLIVLTIVVCKGNGKKKNTKTYTEEERRASVEKYHEEVIQRLKDSGKDIAKHGGYIGWLYIHRPESEKAS